MNLTCLVLEPAAVVLEDLTTMIKEAASNAMVAGATSIDDAVEAVRCLGAVDVAFVNLPPQGFSATPIGEVLTEAGATVIFLGYEVEAQALGRKFLERPVLAAALADNLKRLEHRPRSNIYACNDRMQHRQAG